MLARGVRTHLECLAVLSDAIACKGGREPVKASVENLGLRRQVERLSRVGILTSGEFNVEAAAEDPQR